MFLSSTYYDIWLYCHTMVYLLVDFRVGDFDERVVSTRLKKSNQISVCRYASSNLES